MIGTIVEAGVNQLLSQYNASQDFKRQKALMDKQFGMQNALQKSSAINQVEGLRMAGLNPALAGSNPSSAQSVSLGSSSQAQTFPISAADMLLDAQRENIEAQTAKIRSEIPNVDEDTSLKVAERLFKNQGRKKLAEETQNLRNVNAAYAEQNRRLAEHGKAIAQKWRNSEWFQGLAPDTQAAINGIADGEIPLSVGAMSALQDVIKMQKDMSDADRALVNNAFLNAVASAQFQDKDVMSALSKMPKAQYDLAVKHKEELDSVIAKISAEIPKIVAEAKNLDEARKMLKAQIKSFIHSDLGFLKAQGYETGDFTHWIERFGENQLENLFDIGKAYVAGRGLRAGQTPATPPASKPEPSTIVKPGDPVFRGTLENMNRGVHQFRF